MGPEEGEEGTRAHVRRGGSPRMLTAMRIWKTLPFVGKKGDEGRSDKRGFVWLSCACRQHIGDILLTLDKFPKFGRQGPDTSLLSDFFLLFLCILMSGNVDISIVMRKY